VQDGRRFGSQEGNPAEYYNDAEESLGLEMELTWQTQD
jgi:hypothetical protein